jgi:TonB family protein
VTDRQRLAASTLASLGLHFGALASAASVLSPEDRFLPDAHRGPRLDVTLVAAAPPALAVDAALPPMAEAVRAFSARATPPRPGPAAAGAAPEEKPETVYYSAREVDVRAVPLGEIVPVNPDLTGRESGSVVLRLQINSTGTVDNVLVVRAEPHRTFGPQIILPFKQARFLPARKSGVAVNSEMLIELRYGPLESDKP